MQDIVCDHCGGADFYKEAGYYFCSGCQIQSQEVQEYAYDEYAGVGDKLGKQTTRKIQSDKTAKTNNKITSWECYNYILLGLTNELIDFGADKRIKSVVRILWLKYLEKLEVIKRGRDAMPKLQGVNSDTDAEIVYGAQKPKKKRRRKSSSSEMDTTSLNSSSMNRERAKRKRALVKAQYDEFSQKSQGTPSLHNETLTSLQTGSEKSSINSVPISYNYHFSKEIKKIEPSYCHWRRHRQDLQRKLKCHKITYRKVSGKFKISAYILSLNKLYAILYLALLIVEDRIQLSDMLRFINEGHLSFNSYNHFFPDDFTDKILNFRNFKKISVFKNYHFRVTTLKMAAFLQVHQYISCPDLVELCERYCKELNLPREICQCAKKILSKSKMRMAFCKYKDRVPNYEGRVLSLIIFVMKLLFGLDDVTEFHFAKYTNILNLTDCLQPKFFNVLDWLKYIEYRGLIMSKHHFPSSGAEYNDLSLPLSVLNKKQYETDIKLNSKKDNYKQLLDKVKDVLMGPEGIDFPVTLTPYIDYVKHIPKRNYLDILDKDFSNHSLVHVLNPAPFLSLVNKGENPKIINGGANEDWHLEKVFCCKLESLRRLKESREFVTVTLTLDETPQINDNSTNCEESVDIDIYREDFQAINERFFRQNLRRLAKHLKDIDLDVDKIRRDLNDVEGHYPTHYNPYERFWLRTRIRMDTISISRQECQAFLEQFPLSFRVLFNECARIAHQTEHEFLEEYQFTELFLTYSVKYSKAEKKVNAKERLVANFLTRNARRW